MDHPKTTTLENRLHDITGRSLYEGDRVAVAYGLLGQSRLDRGEIKGVTQCERDGVTVWFCTITMDRDEPGSFLMSEGDCEDAVLVLQDHDSPT